MCGAACFGCIICIYTLVIEMEKFVIVVIVIVSVVVVVVDGVVVIIVEISQYCNTIRHSISLSRLISRYIHSITSIPFLHLCCPASSDLVSFILNSFGRDTFPSSPSKKSQKWNNKDPCKPRCPPDTYHDPQGQ